LYICLQDSATKLPSLEGKYTSYKRFLGLFLSRCH